jgi:hypothetical protein
MQLITSHSISAKSKKSNFNKGKSSKNQIHLSENCPLRRNKNIANKQLQATIRIGFRNGVLPNAIASMMNKIERKRLPIIISKIVSIIKQAISHKKMLYLNMKTKKRTEIPFSMSQICSRSKQSYWRICSNRRMKLSQLFLQAVMKSKKKKVTSTYQRKMIRNPLIMSSI